jgi:protein involved in polysaccharide export with SLBB domain
MIARKAIRRLVLAAILFYPGALHASPARAGDFYTITLRGVPPSEAARVNGVYPLSADGTFLLPLIPRLKVEGFQLEKVARMIEEAYRKADIYENPSVSVIHTRHPGCGRSVVHVGGWVLRPGWVKYEDGMTMGDALHAVGGIKDAPRFVVLYRKGVVTRFDVSKEETLAHPLEENDTIEAEE